MNTWDSGRNPTGGRQVEIRLLIGRGPGLPALPHCRSEAGRHRRAGMFFAGVQVPGGRDWYSYPPGAGPHKYTFPPINIAGVNLKCVCCGWRKFPRSCWGVCRCRLVWLASPLPPSERARLDPSTLAFRQYMPAASVVLASVIHACLITKP